MLIWTCLAVLLLGFNAALDWQTTYLSDKLNILVIWSSLLLVPFDLQFWRQALIWGIVNVAVYEVLYLFGLLYFGDVKYAFGLGMLLATTGRIEQYLFAQILTFLLLTVFALIQLTRIPRTEITSSKPMSNFLSKNINQHTPNTVGSSQNAVGQSVTAEDTGGHDNLAELIPNSYFLTANHNLRFTFLDFSAQPFTNNLEFPAAPLMFLGTVLAVI
jgi:Flp pilus assembly protein protease CpaA